MSEEAPAADAGGTSGPNAARVYDYLLGGKDHYAADRAMGDQVALAWPAVRVAAREQRKFLGRAVRYLAREAGVRQFLDVGAGLPTASNVHEIAQSAAPDAHVVYVDNDPVVLAHARALLTSAPQGRTAYLNADLRDPAAILASAKCREVLDFRRPVALIMVGILHLVPDEDQPRQIVAELVGALPSGSYLAASQMTAEHDADRLEATAGAFRGAGLRGELRDASDFADLAFRGLELVPPGVTLVSQWRPDSGGPRPSPAEVSMYGGVARKLQA